MEYQIIEVDGKQIVECLPGERLTSEQDALDLVGVCAEHRTNLLVLHPENFTPDFYDLKTRLAGNILLKFSNYYIRAAAILDPVLAGQERFREMVLETNRGNQFRVFFDREPALRWLQSLP